MRRSGVGQTRRSGFTLLEVMAAVLVLGLLYAVLAEAAMRGLRSEGIDRRRAEASLIADREVADLEAAMATLGSLPPGVVEDEQPPYSITLEVAAQNVLDLLPPEVAAEIDAERDPQGISLLGNDRIESRVQRLTVVVAWDEAGQPHQVERTTWGLDRSDLAAFFPEGAAPGEISDEETAEELAARGIRSPDELGRTRHGARSRSDFGGRRPGRSGGGSGGGGGGSGPGGRPSGPTPGGGPAQGGTCDQLPPALRTIARELDLCR